MTITTARTEWVPFTSYFDRDYYWIDLNPERTLMRTAWTEDRADAAVQSITRAPERDALLSSPEVLMQSDIFGIDGDDTVFIDGAAYVMGDA